MFCTLINSSHMFNRNLRFDLVILFNYVRFLLMQIMLWMMFGCKYIHQSLEFLGTERAQKMGLVKLLQQLQRMEDLL